jgi:hypothetical protein
VAQSYNRNAIYVNIRKLEDAMMASNAAPTNDEFHRLLLVVKDLALQLDENRQAAAKLRLHADLLKVFSTVCLVTVGAAADVQVRCE